MDRASWVLNRQLIPTRAALRSRTNAWTSLPRASSSGSRCFRQQPGQHAELDFRHVQPTPVLGGVVELQALGNPSGLGRWERLVQRRRAVGVEIVQDHPPPPGSPDRLHPPASASGGRSPAWCAAGSPPPAATRPAARRPGTGCGCLPAGIRGPAAGEVQGPGRQRGPGLRQQLGGGLVKADHRTLGVIRFGVQVQHVLHVGPRTRRSPWGCTTPASATA